MLRCFMCVWIVLAAAACALATPALATSAPQAAAAPAISALPKLPSITLQLSSNAINAGDPLTVTATMQNVRYPSGFLFLCFDTVAQGTHCYGGGTIGTAAIVDAPDGLSATAQTVTTAVPVGTHTISAEFVGDSNNTAVSSSIATVTVAAAGADAVLPAPAPGWRLLALLAGLMFLGANRILRARRR